MLVVVDDREPPEVAAAFERLLGDAMVVTKTMAIGDIRIGPLTVERKTTQDFINSWFNGRLQEQIAKLIQGTKHPMLLVHHDARDDYGVSAEDMERVAERLQTINLAIPTVWRPSLDDAVTWLASRVDYLRSGEWLAYVKRPARVASGGDDPVVELYAGLPHIGLELATRLKAAYPAPAALIAAVTKDAKWFRVVDGIGSKKAACVVAVLTSGIHPAHAKPPAGSTPPLPIAPKPTQGPSRPVPEPDSGATGPSPPSAAKGAISALVKDKSKVLGRPLIYEQDYEQEDG